MVFTPLAREPSVETETRLVVPDVDTFGPGDITLHGGVGVSQRKRAHDGALVLDSQSAVSFPPTGLFVPALATLPTLELSMPTEVRYLQVLEALIIGTTPGASTETDHYAVRAAGAASGALDVGLIGDVREHRATIDHVISPTDNTALSTGELNEWGYAMRFTPTSDITIETLGVLAGQEKSGGGAPRRLVVLDAAITEVLAASDWSTATFQGSGGGSNAVWYDLDLLTSFDLVQGTDYWFAIEFDGLTTLDPPRTAKWDNPIGDADMQNVDVANSGNSRLIDAGSSAESSPFVETDPANMFDHNDAVPFRASGNSDGVAIFGNLQLSLVTNGAPPADPTDVNVHLLWA